MSLINIAAGIALLIAGLCLFGRAALLSGRAVGWPTAPRWLRFVFEAIAVVFLAYGAIIVSGRLHATFGLMIIAIAIAVLTSATFVNLVLQREARS